MATKRSKSSGYSSRSKYAAWGGDKKAYKSYKRARRTSKRSGVLSRGSAASYSVGGQLPEEVKTLSPTIFPIGTLVPAGFAAGGGVRVLPFTCNPLNALVVNSMSSGSGGYQRVGRKINMKYVHIRGTIMDSNSIDAFSTPIVTVAYPPMELRLVLVHDNSFKGLPPNYNTIFKNLDAAGNNNAALALTATPYDNSVAVNSLLDPSNGNQYTVLMDKRFRTPQMSEVAYGTGHLAVATAFPGTLFVDEHVDLLNSEATYSDANGTYTSIMTGALILFAVCTHPVPVTDPVQGFQPWVFCGTVNLKFVG